MPRAVARTTWKESGALLELHCGVGDELLLHPVNVHIAILNRIPCIDIDEYPELHLGASWCFVDAVTIRGN